MEEMVKELGFDSVKEFHRMVAGADITTNEKLQNFKDWQENDGSKEGLLKLPLFESSVEELTAKQEAMSNEALIGFAEDQITKLAETGGRSHTMCVPPEITDTDMLFSELIRRFKKANETIERLGIEKG